jgi:uncharacterized membrane protein
MRTAAAWAFAAVVSAWAAWILALPAMLDRDPPSGPATVAVALTYRIAGVVCHQEDSRSFHIGQWPLPVCARCTGLYVGAVCGALAGLWTGRRTSRGSTRTTVPIRVVRFILLVAALPSGVLWLAEWIFAAPVLNMVRAVGGIPLGAAVSWTVTVVLLGVAMTDNPPQSPSGSSSAAAA